MEVALLCIFNWFMRQSFGTSSETKQQSDTSLDKATKIRHTQVKYQDNNYQKEKLAFKLNYLNNKEAR